MAQYGTSMHIIYHHISSYIIIISYYQTWLEEQVKTLSMLPSPSSYAPADYSHKLHLVCYCQAWNLTWHFDHTRSALSIVTTSRLQFNQVSKPGCHRPHWTSSNWKMSPSCQVARTIQIGLQWCLYTDPYNGCIRRFELWKQMPQVHWVEHQVVSSTCFPPALSSFIISLIGRWEINIYTCLLSWFKPYGGNIFGHK